MIAVAVVFWVAVGLLVYAQVGYPLLLELLARLRRGRGVATATDGAAGHGGRDAAPAPHAAEQLEQQRIAELRVDEQADGDPEDDRDGGHRSSAS